MKKKLMIIGIICLIIMLGIVHFVFASESWTDAKRYNIRKGENWKTTAADWQKMGANKTTNKNLYEVYTISKTMWSSPVVRLVNSNNYPVSNEIQTAPTGKIKKGQTNTAQIGYAYYLSIKPGWNQASQDGSIKLQMKNY